jgi:hypothetical protein
MEDDQTVIIKFLWNERADARQIVTILQAELGENSYQLRTVQFWIGEIRRCCQDLHDEMRSRRPPLDDLDSKILVILEKSPFGSSRSMAQRLAVVQSIVLWHLHESIAIKSFHLRCVPHQSTDDLRQKRRSMQALDCYFCMLPNMMDGIILCRVMSRGFSSIHHHVECGRCREIM